MDIFDRFYDKVHMEPNSGCWLWAAHLNGNGYGTFAGYSGRTELAHRVSYQMHIDEIPDGLQLDHLCRVKCCVNPAHLEPVTNRENAIRGDGGKKQKAKTHCPRGHEYIRENTYVSKKNKRHCRMCTNERDRKKRRRGGLLVIPYGQRTHCPSGHPYSGANLYMGPDRRRSCRTCKKEQMRVRRAAARAQAAR